MKRSWKSMEGKLGPKQGFRCPVRLPFFLPWIKMWHKSIFPSGLKTANWVNMFFFQWKLQNHREERMAAGALVYTTRNNFICRSRFLTISLICAVSVVTNLLGNSWFGSWQDVKFATTGSTVLYVFWLTDNFCAILHQFRIGCILHKTISLCTKLHISACAALKRLNSGYVWTVCTRWNKVQTGSQTLHLVTFVRATALVNYLLKALGA